MTSKLKETICSARAKDEHYIETLVRHLHEEEERIDREIREYVKERNRLQEKAEKRYKLLKKLFRLFA